MTKAINKSLIERCMMVLSCVLSFLFLGSSVLCQEVAPATTQTIVMEVVPESGCPVEITGARTELGFDSFSVPVFGKTYIDYKNSGEKAINAVKFRVRYLDQNGATRGTFHANDEAFVPQGGLASGKFAHYKLRPNIHSAKIRVLAIKFSDGSTWESVRMKAIQKAQQEGKEIDADDEAADKQSVAPAPVKTEPANPPASATPSQEPAALPATQAPAKEPLSATPATVVPATAAPAATTPVTTPITPVEEPYQSSPVSTSAPSTSEPAKPMVEEEPLSATPKAMPIKKNGDPFSQ
jgi:hypothetical protein